MEQEHKTHIHFIGVGGCGVSAVAQIAHHSNYVVTGSDMSHSVYTDKLESQKIPVFYDHDAKHVTDEIDLVVRSSAIPNSNIEVKEAKKKKIPVIKHAEFLGILMEHKYGICIAGSHGKTTTDALLGLMFQEAALDPTVEVGGWVPDFDGNVLTGASRYFVAEACEFDHSFLHLKPNVAVVLNIEQDHPDYYPDMKSLKQAFIDYINLVPDDGFIIANDESKEVQDVLKHKKTNARVITFGFHETAQIKIHQDRLLDSGHWQFQLQGIETEGKMVLPKARVGLLPFEMALSGKHNILNATAALIVADLVGADLLKVRSAMSRFKGVGRRFEHVDSRYGMEVIADYAHHPSQIKATIKAAKREKYKQIIVVFQPHTYSRTKALFEEFTKCFISADHVFITKTYVPAGRKEKKLKGYTAKDLAQAVGKQMRNVTYVDAIEDLREYLDEIVNSGDVILLLGAGDIYKIGNTILDLGKKRKKGLFS